MVCDGLEHARFALSCDNPRGRELDAFQPTSASHCFLLRVPAPLVFPASFRSIRFALFPWLASLERETGGKSVSRRIYPLRRVVRVRAWRFRPRTPEPTEPLTPLSLRPRNRDHSRERVPRRSQDHIRECSVKSSPHAWPEVPFIVQLPGLSRPGRSRTRSREFSAPIRHPCPFAPGRCTLSRAKPETRRPSLSTPNSSELAAPASLRQDTAVDFCNDIRGRASTTLERPILARASGRAFPPALLRSPRFLRGPRRHPKHASGPCLLSKDGLRATPHQRRRSREVQAHPRVGRRSSKPPPRSACEAA